MKNDAPHNRATTNPHADECHVQCSNNCANDDHATGEAIEAIRDHEHCEKWKHESASRVVEDALGKPRQIDETANRNDAEQERFASM